MLHKSCVLVSLDPFLLEGNIYGKGLAMPDFGFSVSIIILVTPCSLRTTHKRINAMAGTGL